MSVLGEHPGLVELTDEECHERLGRLALGRVGLTSAALPVVLPVNYAATELGIVIRTTRGSKFDAAMANNVVCFEVDGADPVTHDGWSVVVTGIARVLEGAERERAQRLAVPHWVDDDADNYLAIPYEKVTGRRLRHRSRV